MKHYIDYSNEVYKDRIFISYNNNQITFSEFYYNVSIKSRAFTSLNLSEKSIIGILLSSPIDILETYFSCIQLNKTPLIFPTDITDYELQEIINSHKIDFIISEWTRKKQISTINNCNFFYIQELVSNYGGCASVEFSSDIQDKLNIQSLHLTSGSTGLPKLVSLSFNNFISSTLQWDNQLSFLNSDRYIQCLPLNHIAGLSIIMRSQIKGFETILMNKFNANKINSEIDHGATLISLIPSMLKRLLNIRGGNSFPRHFRGAIIGGDSCSKKLIQEAINYGMPIYKTYGMTETCSGIAGFWVNDNPENLESVGKSFNDTKITISDKKLIIKGPTIAPFINGKKNKNQLFETSDIGILKKGFLFIKGRSDDIVISAGENISLSHIKNILLNHPNVIDVYLDYEKDEHSDGEVNAYIEVNDSLISNNDIFSYCREFLSEKSCPKDIQIVEKINHD